MNKPMTTAEATERFGCSCPDWASSSSLLDSTCSYTCPHCRGHIWFPGFVGNTGNPTHADCPYCGKPTINPFPERRTK